MPTTQPYVTITTSAGVASRFLLTPGTVIHRDPVSGQSQVTTVGDASRRGDSRTPEVIFSTSEDGMGEFEYQELEGISTFTDSTCDTRYPNIVVLPPVRTQLGGTVTAAIPTYVENIGYGSVKLLVWQRWASTTSVYTYNTSTSAWTGYSALSNLGGFARYNGYYIFSSSNLTTTALWTSVDAATWVATTGAGTRVYRGICTHDNKLYVYAETVTGGTSNVLRWTNNPTSDAAWTDSSVLYLQSGETVNQLIEWQYRGSNRVFLLTNFRILWYDEDADVFMTFDDSWRGLVSTSFLYPQAMVSPANGDLYVCFYNAADGSMQDAIMHYGGSRELLSPNKRGGVPQTSRVSIAALTGGLNWTWVNGVRAYNTSGVNYGRVMAMRDGAFHTLWANTGQALCGVGYGQGRLWSVDGDGKVYEQVAPDNLDLPLYRASGEVSYPTTLTSAEPTYWHEYAWTDAGSPNMPKQALWLTLDMRDISSTTKKSGMAPGTGVVVQYMTNTSGVWKYHDGATSYTSATHLYTSANPTTAVAYPVVVPLSSGFGVSFKQIKIRVGLATTSAANTPVLASVALAYVRQEQPRYAYSFQVDLTDLSHPFYAGKDRFQLLTLLDSYVASGSIVKLEFAGDEWSTGSDPAGGRTVANGTFTFGGIEDAATGAGKYNCQILDLTPPSSG